MRSRKPQLEEILSRMARRDSHEDTLRLPDEIEGMLRNNYSSLMQKHQFRVGEIVRWKEGLKNRQRPRYGEPAIVVDVLAVPVVDESDGSGSPYFREPLDLVLGVIDEDGELQSYYFDRRRFEPVRKARAGKGSSKRRSTE